MSRLTELAAYLKAHDDFAVFGHVNPDGDASGSCIALCLALRALGKNAYAYLPGGLANMYRCFETTAPIASGDELPFAPRTGFSVDTSELNRLGSGEAIFMNCPEKCMLDHHETNAGFGDVYFVDGSAASCGELALELIRELGVELTREMAEWIYIAICTDCGRFGFSSTTPQTMISAAQCLSAGIDVDRIHRLLYRTRSEGRTRLLGIVLSQLEMNEDKTLCWARITRQMMDRAGAIAEDREGVVNYLLEIEGVKIACLAEERGEAVTKFSLRSQPPVDVGNKVCKPLGGGGHAQAAGITMDLPLEEALAIVLRQAETVLK